MLPHSDWWIEAGVEAAVWEPHVFSQTKWKVTQLQFRDGSYYNVGQPDQGPHEADSKENDYDAN